ncbi:MAG: hypothetical protein HYU66_09095 [Armatimonadetes bacterium]|nr:hypothetical protein [Armatimonadota bacterium]
MRVTACGIVLLALATARAAEPLVWSLDRQADAVSAVNLQPGRVRDGRLCGWTSWDPFVFLKVAEEGFDATALTQLTLRLYSSAPADLLDIYYKSPDGRWCLGGKLPIVKGWAVYRVDLTRNAWRETLTGDVSRQWGGPSRRVNSFRIDPGNQAERWVMVDEVHLAPPEPGFAEGVTPEPAAAARLEKLTVPATVEAGSSVAVVADLAVTPPAARTGTAFLRLRQGATIMDLAEQPVTFGGDHLRVEGRLTTSRYWYPGDLSVEVGVYELEPDGGKLPKAALRFTNPRVGTTRPPVVKLQRVGGDPTIVVNGRPVPGMMYCSHGGLHLDYHREIAQAGLHVYSDWFGTSVGADQGHLAPDRYDYAEYDRYFAAILEVDPEAWFLPHLGVTAPNWWQELHKEECSQAESGRRYASSFASELWRRDSAEDLRRLLAHLRRAPYADRILGLIFYSGYTAEWQMWGTWEESRDDYSAPAVRAFRAYLKRLYGTDARLRRAWADPQATLAGAAPPDWQQRRPDSRQVLRDPRTEQPCIDYYTFISNLDGEALLHFAHVARQATGGTQLVGTYYAYLSAHGINQLDSGHCAAQRVFDSPDIDFLMSPPNYAFRAPGEVSTFMSATDSMRLRGKLWLNESDNRTYLSDPSAGFSRADNLPDTLGVFWREFAEMLCKRAAVSWFDMAGGWFSGPEVLAAIGQARRIAGADLRDRQPFQAEVGLFIDLGSIYHTRSTDALRRMILNQLCTMPKAGAPFDYCLLDDLERPWMPDYKLYVFLNAFRVDPAKRDAIQRKLRRSHATALFVYAPGWFGESGPSLDGVRKLTGIRVERDDVERSAQLQLIAGDPLAKGLDADRPLGAENVVQPLFYAADPNARMAARLSGSDRAGLVVKPNDGWTAVYSAAMDLPPGLMRNLARSAGVHIWLDSDDAVYADGRYVGVHAAGEGAKTVHLPRAAKVTELIGGRTLTVKGRDVALTLKKGETALLEVGR